MSDTHERLKLIDRLCAIWRATTEERMQKAIDDVLTEMLADRRALASKDAEIKRLRKALKVLAHDPYRPGSDIREICAEALEGEAGC